jgi:hypothetical protein
MSKLFRMAKEKKNTQTNTDIQRSPSRKKDPIKKAVNFFLPR